MTGKRCGQCRQPIHQNMRSYTNGKSVRCWSCARGHLSEYREIR